MARSQNPIAVEGRPPEPAEACRWVGLLPAETSTLAKSPVYANGIASRLFAVSAHGARFTDKDAESWLDCDMALGAVVLGHSPSRLVDAVARQVACGTSFSVPSVLEGKLAERILTRLHPFEQIQFAKNGSDVTTAAVRLARAATGRRHVVLGSFHGWQDWSAIHHYGGGAELGILEDVKRASIWIEGQTAGHVLQAVDAAGDVAAVVICPEHWSADDLREVRNLTARAGIVLVFDEVKSGMRFGRRGVYGTVGVTPDLLCLGKGLANGMALSALLGSKPLMALLPGIRFSATHATETVAMAAALAVESMLDEIPEWPPWDGLSRQAMAALDDTIARLGLGGRLSVQGYPGTFWIGDGAGKMDSGFRTHFMHSLAAFKVFSRGYVVPSAAHGAAEFAILLEACHSALAGWAASSS